MRFQYLVVVFLVVFTLLSIVQYMDFYRPSLETYGYREWDLDGILDFRDESLVRIPKVDPRKGGDGIGGIPVNVTIMIVDDGYVVVDRRLGVEVLRARFSGRDVMLLNWSSGEFVNIGFSPFLVIWPVKPKPILMHLMLRQVDITYLGFKPEIDYDWYILAGILEISTPLTYLKVNVPTPHGIVTLEDTFNWFYVSYKGSLPLLVDTTIPIDFVNREFLERLGVEASVLEKARYLDFSLKARRGKELEGVVSGGTLYFLYPVLGSILASVGVALYPWVSRRFSKHT